jgi:hypothetical protein
MSRFRFPYRYKIKVGNKIIYKGVDKRLASYLLAAWHHRRAKVEFYW